jgi:hypothetical protein
MNLADTTNAHLLDYLVDTAGVPDTAKMSYAAGYFEGCLLTLMDRYPEVRKHIEERVAFRMKESV